MKQFLEIYKKVGGREILRQYRKSHVLVYALLQTLLQGFSKKSLEIVRLSVDKKILSKLRKSYKAFIRHYVQEHEAETLEKKHADIIWTSWLQGMENAPHIVQKCYESVQNHIRGKEIVVITEENYSDYVTFPDFILDKYKSGIISKTHFSDLLRIELLAQYGGTWMDSTVYCTGEIEQNDMLDSELFLFQCLKPGLDGHCTAISSWLMTADSNHKIILLTRALLYEYWRKHDSLADYFLLHDFFQLAIEAYPEEWNKVIPFSNSTPHILLLRLFEEYDETIWNAVRKQTGFHKLTYKFSEEQSSVRGTYYDVIFGSGKHVVDMK